MERQDLTMHSDDELSLWVFNDEYLYKMRRQWASVVEVLTETFKFNDEQLEVLKKDIEDDLGEE